VQLFWSLINPSQIVIPYLWQRFATKICDKDLRQRFVTNLCHKDLAQSQQKVGTIIENKVLQKIDISKSITDESCSTNLILLAENHFQNDSADFRHWK